eukprot:1187443-Prorocentrum_minimum.AAC.4
MGACEKKRHANKLSFPLGKPAEDDTPEVHAEHQQNVDAQLKQVETRYQEILRRSPSERERQFFKEDLQTKKVRNNTLRMKN